MTKDCTIALPKNEAVSCFFWADECVAFNELRGETHLLADAGAFLIKAISGQPLSRQQLLIDLTANFDFPADFDLEIFLDGLIFNYLNLGLLTVTENYQP